MISTHQEYRVIAQRANGATDVSGRAILLWPLEQGRAGRIMARSESFPNCLPCYIVVKAPDASAINEFRGNIYMVGYVEPQRSELVLHWGREMVGANPVSPWHFRDSETFKNPDNYLLGEVTGYYWRIIHASARFGDAPSEVILRAFRA